MEIRYSAVYPVGPEAVHRNLMLSQRISGHDRLATAYEGITSERNRVHPFLRGWLAEIVGVIAAKSALSDL